jgi:hypothetical protein
MPPSIICGCRRWPSAQAQSEISEPNPYRARNRKFESTSLHRRVSNEQLLAGRLGTGENGLTSDAKDYDEMNRVWREFSRSIRRQGPPTRCSSATATASKSSASLSPGKARPRPVASGSLIHGKPSSLEKPTLALPAVPSLPLDPHNHCTAAAFRPQPTNFLAKQTDWRSKRDLNSRCPATMRQAIAIPAGADSSSSGR